MRIGFITDEISPNIEEAVSTGVSWGILDYELRSIAGKRIPYIDAGARKKLHELKKRHNIRFTALSPGAFKRRLSDSARLNSEIEETLPKTFALAEELDVSSVIVFGFLRAPEDPSTDRDKVVRILRDAAEEARKHGLTLCLENEPGFWCDNGANTAGILAEIDHPNLKANWDPANGIETGEIPFPDGYGRIKPWLANLHIKDTAEGALRECVPVGDGLVDWDGQIQAIKKDGSLECVTIETHCTPLIEASKYNLAKVRALLRE